MARVIVQRWPEVEHYAKVCATCDRSLAVFAGTVACPFCGEIYLSRLRDARIGKILTEAFPHLRIVSGTQWPGYVQPLPPGHRPAVPRAVPNPPTDDESIEILTLFGDDA